MITPRMFCSMLVFILLLLNQKFTSDFGDFSVGKLSGEGAVGVSEG